MEQVSLALAPYEPYCFNALSYSSWASRSEFMAGINNDSRMTELPRFLPGGPPGMPPGGPPGKTGFMVVLGVAVVRVGANAGALASRITLWRPKFALAVFLFCRASNFWVRLPSIGPRSTLNAVDVIADVADAGATAAAIVVVVVVAVAVFDATAASAVVADVVVVAVETVYP